MTFKHTATGKVVRRGDHLTGLNGEKHIMAGENPDGKRINVWVDEYHIGYWTLMQAYAASLYGCEKVKPFPLHTKKLEPEFTFAGFTFPKYVWTLPKGTTAKRLSDAKNTTTGPYYHAPRPNSDGTGFYHESDGAPGLRFVGYAVELHQRIDHTGWYTDQYGEGDKIRGIVFRLPKSRGFLSGWTMGKGMASALDTDCIHDDEEEAALAADESARIVADKEMERDVRRGEIEDRVRKLEHEIELLETEEEERRTKLVTLRDELETLEKERDELL